MTSTTERPLRSDAARNRQLILEAASEAFAEHGRDACVEDIAKRAGVGVGTLYRRFPTKTALAEEIADTLLEHLHTLAAETLATESQGQALETCVVAVCGLRSKYGRALVWLYTMPSAADRVIELKGLTAQMIGEGQQAGILRLARPQRPQPADVVGAGRPRGDPRRGARRLAPPRRGRLRRLAGHRRGAPADPPLSDAESDAITQLQRS